MNETEFIKLSEQTLQNILDKIEEADKEYKIEIDLIDGILNIDLPDGGQYIINKHLASKEIWLSSPKSGASHFSYQEDEWLDSKGNNLFKMLNKELSALIELNL